VKPSLARAAAIACLACVAWLGAPRPAFADAERDDVPAGQWSLRVFSGADGLRNLVINGIAQDARGLLWLATDEGAYRFDGERFAHFSVAEGLTSSAVLVVGIGPAGEACVGAGNGLACWDGARFSQSGALGLPAVPIHAVVSYGGKLWVGTDGAGLYVRGATGPFSPAPGWTGASDVRALFADSSGLIAGDDAAVQLTTGDGEWRRIALGAIRNGDGRDRVTGALRDRDGALWIRTAAHLWHLPRGAAAPADLQAGLPISYVRAGVSPGMVIDPRGKVLIGSDFGIAYREGEHWRVLDQSIGLPSSDRTLFVDRDGALWIGGAGLVQLRGRGLIEHYRAATGLPGGDAWGFQRDRQGRLWVATNHCLARAQGGRWECLAGTEGRTIRSFAFPPQGGVFVGGAPSDLLYIDPAGRATSLGGAGQSQDRMILALAIDPRGDLWIATEAGLDRLPGAVPGPEPGSGTIEHVAIPGRRPGGRFASLLVAGDQVWTANEQGIAMVEHGTWHRFDVADGFRSSAMRYLIRRDDGRFCVSYNEAIGITCFRYDAGAIADLEHLRPDDGLSAGMVYFLGEDRQHRLWIGTGTGVNVVTGDGIDHFDASDGMAGDDAAATAFLCDRDGSLWLGATGGATHLFAQFYRGRLAAPEVAFLDGRIGDAAVTGATGPLEVPHDRSALSLELGSSTLSDPRHIEYQVRLSPMEAEWTTAPQRRIHYPALPAGAYRFEVRARIGIESFGPTAALPFTVLPAWWQTRWFYGLFGIAGIVAIASGFTWRQRTVLRRRTRQLNQRSDASFRAVIDLMPDLIAIYRPGELIYLNVASRRFFGLDDAGRGAMRGRLFERVHPDDRAEIAALFVGLRARGRDMLGSQLASEVVELQLRAADGSWRTCELSVIRVEIGGAPTLVVSGRDITERKRMRAKLLVSDRMASLGTLAAGIAHEINNPLAYVTGNLEAMAEAIDAAKRAAVPADCDDLSSVVSDARDGAERVRKIVHGLRAFSRSQDDEQRTPLAVTEVLEAALRLTGNEIRHRAQLVRALGPVPPVLADDGRLTQVFINLLVNAAQAIPAGKSDANRITVRTRTDDAGRAVIEVEDTGNGMPPEVAARVFDPFFTTKGVGEGTGLGLSICHGIIAGLDGQIAIDSAVGRGTTVRVVLPAHTGAPTVPVPVPVAAAAEPAAAPPRRHRVMLVDDEPQVVHTMERLLRRDYDITIALCGRDAIDHIARGARFDAIVSDVMMPNMTGIELTEELQRIAPDQARRLIFLSGGAFTAQTHERLHALGAPQLEKPVTARELRACVQRVVTDAPPAA
jgi:PAS domain S-box-containing protein